MTDISLVKKQLKVLLSCDDSQVEDYESYINNAILSVMPMLKNEEAENDGRVVYLCAAKAYYQINLTKTSDDGITSFKAGDVSYEIDTSSLPKAKALYEMALDDCNSLIDKDPFDFRTV